MHFALHTRNLFISLCLASWLCIAFSPVCSAIGVDWNSNMITAIGVGSAPEYAIKPGQANALARRAAVVDAYRNLASIVYGVEVENHTTVAQLTVKKDTIKTAVAGIIRNARIIDEEILDDSNYQVTLSMPLFGKNSLSAALWQQTSDEEDLPLPAPAAPVMNSTAGTTATVPTATGATAAVPAVIPKDAYSGLVIDCRSLGLERAMAPNVIDTSGRTIYSSQNVANQNMIRNGLTSYVKDINDSSISKVAGSNPLVIRGVALTDFHRNPVISKDDGDKIIAAIQHYDFLKVCAVVLVE
jgi:hypothetical protein